MTKPESQTFPRSLKDNGIRRSYQQGELLFHSGEQPKGIYIIEDGEIRVFDMDSEGKELEVTRLEARDIFGEALLFASKSIPFYAEAVKASHVLLVPRQSVLELIEKDPEVSRFFLILMAEKCLILNQRVRSLGLKTVRQRLVGHLVTNCRGNKCCRIELGMNKGDLARLLGTVNETLSRNLRQLQEEGLIQVDGKKILIKDCMRLRRELAV